MARLAISCVQVMLGEIHTNHEDEKYEESVICLYLSSFIGDSWSNTDIFDL